MHRGEHNKPAVPPLIDIVSTFQKNILKMQTNVPQAGDNEPNRFRSEAGAHGSLTERAFSR